jgi:two-component system phosphate regulon sensor histidine kinase PhoR
MLQNARVVAILLAASVGVITAAFLSLVPDIESWPVILAFLLAFASTYILSYITLEFFIYREISRIDELILRIKKKDLTFTDRLTDPKKSNNPLKQIKSDIHTYAILKQREIEELRRMAEFRREFLADVSHELKTPIFAAQGYIYTLLDGAVKDKSVRNRFLKKAAKSLDGLDILVQDLLMLSQLENKQLKMHFSYFNLAELIRDVFDQLEGKAEKKGIELRLPQEFPDQVWVWADKQRIQQVIMNLTSNAIKYSNESEEGDNWVLVDITAEEDRIKVEVRDNGRGIPQEHLGRIFERFYRVERSRSKSSGGSGLGLAIVKHILEAHHTDIQVTSEVGSGSTFSFDLRKAKPKSDKKKKASAQLEG